MVVELVTFPFTTVNEATAKNLHVQQTFVIHIFIMVCYDCLLIIYNLDVLHLNYNKTIFQQVLRRSNLNQ